MSAPTAPTRISEVAAYAAALFEHEGLTIDRLVERAVDVFCADPVWVRGLVFEVMREAVVAGVRQGPARLIIDLPEAVAGPATARPALPAVPVTRMTAAEAAKAAVEGRRATRVIRRAAAAELAAPPAWAKALSIDPTKPLARPLLSLTREELLDAVGFLDGRSHICRMVAARLQPGQRAGDVLSPAELAALEAELAAGPAPKAVTG